MSSHGPGGEALIEIVEVDFASDSSESPPGPIPHRTNFNHPASPVSEAMRIMRQGAWLDVQDPPGEDLV